MSIREKRKLSKEKIKRTGKLLFLENQGKAIREAKPLSGWEVARGDID